MSDSTLPREEVVIATKTGLGTTLSEQRRWNEQGRRGNTDPARIREQVDNSLRILGEDVGIIDIYQLHVRDPDVEHAAHAETMADLIDTGKIKTWGVSNYSNQELEDLLEACDERDLPRPTTSQPFHNMLAPYSHEKTQYAKDEGLVVLAHSPLIKGVLTDARFQELKETLELYRDGDNEGNQEVLERIAPQMDQLTNISKIARAHGSSLAQVAISWTLLDPNVITLTTATNASRLSTATNALITEINPQLWEAITDLHKDKEDLEFFWGIAHKLIRHIRGY